MKRAMVAVAGFAAVMAMAGVASATTGWDTFVIRNSTVGSVAPVISDSAGGKLFSIVLAGQKAGWGTESMNGDTIGDIASISITRDPSIIGNGPYLNFWITDGLGQYAVLADGPGILFSATGAVLKTQGANVYEASPGFKLPDGTFASAPGKDLIFGYTFADFAGYEIAPPPSHWGGAGAPDDLNAPTYTAYGVNWVFGDTQSNYLNAYLVSDPSVTAVPEPVTMFSAFMGLSSLGMYLRKRTKRQAAA
jgi:hypothetical protein